ncbi:hypothetical protein V6N13_070916 [Hibiscus sabdariffa]|uniref:chorismate mutase n=1 Tax=Hibiscus sabdariffa TaxID=183260 RepID=A0ABR2TFW2_9ROSI
MEAKLLSASSPPSFVVHVATKFSRPSFVLTSLTREFPVFKLQSVHASSNPIVSKTTKVRNSLIRQEDNIIFSLVERAQYCYNENTYDPEAFSMDGFHGSLVGRYTNSDEHPFFPDDLPDHVLPPSEYPQQKKEMMAIGNYISTAVCDTICLQALSKRIHYGKYVAECKYRASPYDYEAAIREQDRDRLMNLLMNLLTYPLVEESIKKRVEIKTMTYGQVVKDDVLKDDERDPVYRIKPSLVANIYGDWIMPLTKEVQVEYLLRRLDLDRLQGN